MKSNIKNKIEISKQENFIEPESEPEPKPCTRSGRRHGSDARDSKMT